MTEKPSPSLPTIAPREQTNRWRTAWHWLMRLTLPSVLLAGLALVIWVAVFINALHEGLAGQNTSQLLEAGGIVASLVMVVFVLQRELRRGRWAFKELKAAQARLQDMTESSFDWAWETDPDLRYAYISGQVTGASISEQNSYIGKTRFEIADLTHDPDGWKRHADDLAARRPFRDFVFRQPGTDGGARWRKVSGKPFYDAAGRFCGYRGTAIDITAQKEAEQALSAVRAQQKERDRSHRTLIANISGAVYRMKMDAEWTDIFISDAVEKIWGYSAAECLAKTAPLFATAIHPDDRDMVTQGTKEAIERRAPYAFEYRIRHRDGSTRWVSDRGQPIFDESGQLLYLDGIFFDVTDRMRAEAELKRAKELAEGANRAKSDFLAMMSHELRTPLNAIIGFSEIVIGEVFGPVGNDKYRGYLSDIQRSGNHLLELINDILDLSKAEAGLMEINEEGMDVAQVIATTIGMVRLRAEEADVRVVTEVPEGLPEVIADERKIRQSLLNLVSNAVKFTPQGGQVTVKALMEGERLQIRIEDTGIGIAAADIPKALSPFGQIDSALSRRHTGTGLGLPLTKRLVEAHGARLEIQSEIGVGTVAIIEFPASRLAPVQPYLQASA
ncbi:MAG: PAS domain-containing sensor histidine kinase [Dongiaceae bacterium]